MCSNVDTILNLIVTQFKKLTRPLKEEENIHLDFLKLLHLNRDFEKWNNYIYKILIVNYTRQLLIQSNGQNRVSS